MTPPPPSLGTVTRRNGRSEAAAEAGSGRGHRADGFAPLEERAPAPGGRIPGGDPELLDLVVRRVFAATLTLSSARNTIGDLATARLDEAIAELDQLIREVRHAACDAHRSAPVSTELIAQHLVQAEPGRAASPLLDQATHRVEQLNTVLLNLWAEAVAGCNAVHDSGTQDRIAGAARLVRLAEITLTATAIR